MHDPPLPPDSRPAALPWLRVAESAPYFVTEDGHAWTPIGQNDGLGWVDLEGLFRGRNIASAQAYLVHLRENGVTCLRLMMEDAHMRHRYLEQPVGRFVPNMVALWDELFALCERIGLRILLTPFDTFWAWMRWRHHPYNARNGGVVGRRSAWLSDPQFRAAIKARLAFAVRRWGGQRRAVRLGPVERDPPGAWRRQRRPFRRLHRRPQPPCPRAGGRTVRPQPPADGFGLRPRADMEAQHEHRRPGLPSPGPRFRDDPHLRERHHRLPRDTVAPARAVGRIVRESLAEIRDGRPFLDTEHGPIHGFNDRRITLPEAFDDEYFRHMQWAHLASGGAGGGMRWPYRNPHRMTPGMRSAQRAMAGFCELIDWPCFRRSPLDVAVTGGEGIEVFACGDGRQAIIWLLRGDIVGSAGMLGRDNGGIAPELTLTGFGAQASRIVQWDTVAGVAVAETDVIAGAGQPLRFTVRRFDADLAIAVTPRR